jgi:hypothetical protein
VTDGRLDNASLLRQFVRQHAWTCALPLAERAIQRGRPLRMPDATTLMQTPAPSSVSGAAGHGRGAEPNRRQPIAAVPRCVAAARLPVARSGARRRI